RCRIHIDRRYQTRTPRTASERLWSTLESDQSRSPPQSQRYLSSCTGRFELGCRRMFCVVGTPNYDDERTAGARSSFAKYVAELVDCARTAAERRRSRSRRYGIDVIDAPRSATRREQ